jgi:hypothetical protein
MKNKNNVKDVFVECKSLVFGKTKFFCFKVPESWFVNPVPYKTDVESWREIRGEKWITRGYTQLSLFPGKEGKPMSIFIKARGYDKELRVEKWLLEKRKEIREKREETLIDSGFIRIQSHKAAYLAYTKLRKKFILFGDENKETILKVVLKCDNTLRTLSFEVSSRFPGYLDNMAFLNNLLNIFSTFTCH